MTNVIAYDEKEFRIILTKWLTPDVYTTREYSHIMEPMLNEVISLSYEDAMEMHRKAYVGF